MKDEIDGLTELKVNILNASIRVYFISLSSVKEKIVRKFFI